MHNLEAAVAAEVRRAELSPDSRVWLEEEINYLALSQTGLDEVPHSAILLLAQLSADGPSNEQQLSRATGLKIEEIDVLLEALHERNFAKACAAGYEATGHGKKIFRYVGKTFIIRKRLETKASFDHLDRLYKAITDAWHSG